MGPVDLSGNDLDGNGIVKISRERSHSRFPWFPAVKYRGSIPEVSLENHRLAFERVLDESFGSSSGGRIFTRYLSKALTRGMGVEVGWHDCKSEFNYASGKRIRRRPLDIGTYGVFAGRAPRTAQHLHP